MQKCPYCAQNIHDDAIICHHCNHEVGSLKQVVARINHLQAQVDRLNRTVHALDLSHGLLGPAISSVLGTILLGAFFSAVSYYFALHLGGVLGTIFQVISIVCCFGLVGLWLGYQMPSLDGSASILVGALEAFPALAGIAIVALLCHPDPHKPDWLLFSMTYILGSLLLVECGRVAGCQLKVWRHSHGADSGESPETPSAAVGRLNILVVIAAVSFAGLSAWLLQ